MFNYFWSNLKKEYKGAFWIAFGFTLLFYLLNVFQKWLSVILALFSILFIVYGFIEADLWNKIKAIQEKK